MIVFVQSGDSEVSKSFERDHLPVIRESADDLGVTFRLIDACSGVPSEVRLTPLIVFQNFRGRSIYQGRYTTTDRVNNFVRTSRFVPQSKVPLVREHIPVFSPDQGRMHVAAPLKVASVTGAKPEGYDHDRFVEESLQAVAAGFKQFRMVERIELGRCDRLFYMDFNPWLTDDGTLFLSAELYSQFHCKEPVFTTGDKPLKGPWSQRGRMFQEMAATLESKTLEQVRSPESGDGFDPIAADIPEVSWESLGLRLPDPPIERKPFDASRPLPLQWTVAKRENNPQSNGAPPQIQFRFPPPFDSYAGEAESLRGQLHLKGGLPNGLRISSATGWFEVDVNSVTMGEADLDHVVHGQAMLDVQRYPTSRFEIESIDEPGEPLRYGELLHSAMRGRFTLKGHTIPITVRTSFEPSVGDDEKLQLVMTGAFEIPLIVFNLPRPDGQPVTQQDQLLFDIRIDLVEGATPKP